MSTSDSDRPIASLPARPSLENLANQAKSLLRSVRAQDEAGVARIVRSHPRFTGQALSNFALAPVRLADAQLVVAREHGFPSWPGL